MSHMCECLPDKRNPNQMKKKEFQPRSNRNYLDFRLRFNQRTNLIQPLSSIILKKNDSIKQFLPERENHISTKRVKIKQNSRKSKFGSCEIISKEYSKNSISKRPLEFLPRLKSHRR